MILRAENVEKSFPQAGSRLEILRGVSLTVAEGEAVAVMGRSGCGKSTLIALLAGLDTPSSGTIEVDGLKLDELSGRELNRFRAQKLGIVFQQFHLLEHLTAFENVRLPLDLNRVEGADRKAKDLLERVGLAHRAEHFPGQMSRGECQRVAIARVLVMQPKVVFADEPTGSLDVKTGRQVMEVIFRFAQTEKFALVLVTHDPTLAASCGRLLYMEEGRLVSERPQWF